MAVVFLALVAMAVGTQQSSPMSNPELWKNWEGRVVDARFPLLRWLGGSNHSAVFLTERGSGEPQKAVVKLIPAENLNQDAQLSRWSDAARLSHPHLIHLFECGSCQLDDTRLLYVVMEYADEDLAQILPLRALAPGEISEMLEPTSQALAFVHRAGYIHGSIQPSNIMAAREQLKISSDGLCKPRERPRESTAYQAPEVSAEGVSPASDAWSLAATLVAAFTQREPDRNNNSEAAVPDALPEPFREIATRCLRRDPRQRYTVSDIQSRLQGGGSAEVRTIAPPTSNAGRRPWVVVPLVLAALVLLVFAGREFLHRPPTPAVEIAPAQPQPTDSRPPKTHPPAPSPQKQTETRETIRGAVLQQVLPEVSRSAQNTIQGRVKVIVRVTVEASGNVSQATLTSAGPSKYFANKAVAAARQWKFKPPQENGQAKASEWLLRFQFGRGSTQVFPTEAKR
ncbi:MAG: TonB family protein [Candidatus Sulfotelmatobacter sp.]